MQYSRKFLVAAIRWLARVTGLLLFLFWGAFFVEHLAEWFSNPSNLPPAWVFLMQGLHFLMLAGFIIAWKWEIPGAVMVIAASWVFFARASGSIFPLFFFITIIPAILHILFAALARYPKNTKGNMVKQEDVQ